MPVQERHTIPGYTGVYYIVSRPGTPKEDKIYYIDYRKDGKRIQEKAGFASKGWTPARANDLRSDRRRGKEPTNAEKRMAEKEAKAAEAGRWTIAKLWDEYCAIHPDNKVLGHEKRKFDLYLRDGIGSKEPSELLPMDVDRLRLGLQKQGKRTTAARVLEILRRALNFGAKRALTPALPFKIEIPRLNNQTTEDLTPAQLKKLIKVLDADEDQTAANVMRLALFTGMRRSEIFKLQWSDIDFQRGFITLRNPKGGRDQTIPLNDTARAIFKGMRQGDKNRYVFPGRLKGTHLTDCRKSLTRIAKAAKLPKGFRPLHGLRHVYASMLASSGKVDLYTLQKLLTHKSPVMTQRYAHLRDEALKQASNLAGNIVSAISAEIDEKEEKTA